MSYAPNHSQIPSKSNIFQVNGNKHVSDIQVQDFQPSELVNSLANMKLHFHKARFLLWSSAW